jgi:hypothetical protein
VQQSQEIYRAGTGNDLNFDEIINEIEKVVLDIYTSAKFECNQNDLKEIPEVLESLNAQWQEWHKLTKQRDLFSERFKKRIRDAVKGPGQVLRAEALPQPSPATAPPQGAAEDIGTGDDQVAAAPGRAGSRSGGAGDDCAGNGHVGADAGPGLVAQGARTSPATSSPPPLLRHPPALPAAAATSASPVPMPSADAEPGCVAQGAPASQMQQPPQPRVTSPPTSPQPASAEPQSQASHAPAQACGAASLLQSEHCLVDGGQPEEIGKGGEKKTNFGLGDRVKIYWEGNRQWFCGVVEKTSRKKGGKVQVRYEVDDEVFWEDIADVYAAPLEGAKLGRQSVQQANKVSRGRQRGRAAKESSAHLNGETAEAAAPDTVAPRPPAPSSAATAAMQQPPHPLAAAAGGAGGSGSVGELASAAGGAGDSCGGGGGRGSRVQDLIGEEKEAVMAEMEAVARRHLRPGGIRDSARGRGEKRSRSRRTSGKSRNNSCRM